MTETIPMELASGGVIPISGTRVSLDSVMGAFQDGASAEEIAQQYPSVPLGDVYEVIGYALRHSDEVERYLTERRAAGRRVRADAELRFPPNGIRARLLARLAREGLTPIDPGE